MPIKRSTEVRRATRLGKIHLGIKVPVIDKQTGKVKRHSISHSSIADFPKP